MVSETSAWSLVAAKGAVPEPRIAASLVAVGTKLYLFGGLNQQNGWMQNFHMFDIGDRDHCQGCQRT